MKNFFFLFILSVFLSCTNTAVEKKQTNEITTQIQSDTKKNNSDSLDSIAELNLSNPVLMQGSTFGNYFQAYYKIGDFDLLMKFTSKESIDKFGYNNIINAYKKMQFAYKIKFKSMNEDGENKWIMNYETEQFATKKMLRFKVKLENDTVKLIIEDVKHIFEE